VKVIVQNKKAFHDYDVLDTLEVGIVLTGDEVKSLRAGHASLAGSFAHVKQSELFLVNAHITLYDKAYGKSEDQVKRSRKLLLHKRELNKLISMVSQKGVTLVPLKIYFNNRNIAKVELGICKHKNAPSRKKELKERDISRQTRREMKGE
jgi:SsrA-binding protein